MSLTKQMSILGVIIWIADSGDMGVAKLIFINGISTTSYILIEPSTPDQQDLYTVWLYPRIIIILLLLWPAEEHLHGLCKWRTDLTTGIFFFVEDPTLLEIYHMIMYVFFFSS